jgi:hypothetical protein
MMLPHFFDTMIYPFAQSGQPLFDGVKANHDCTYQAGTTMLARHQGEHKQGCVVIFWF